jgi:hypothetical protein
MSLKNSDKSFGEPYRNSSSLSLVITFFVCLSVQVYVVKARGVVNWLSGFLKEYDVRLLFSDYFIYSLYQAGDVPLYDF